MRLRALVPLGFILFASMAGAAAPPPKSWKPSKPLPAPAPPPTAVVMPPQQYLPDSAILGHVNDRKLRVFDFRDGWFASLVDYRPKNVDSLSRVEFLNSMVNKEVLALTALAANRPLTFEDRAVMREHTERVLSNVAYQRLVADSSQPTQADLERAYEERSWQLHLQQFPVADLATAEKAKAELIANRITWPAALVKYGRYPSRPAADLGWRAYGTFDPTVARELFTLKEGQYSTSLVDTAGVHLVKLIERRPFPQPPLEKFKLVLQQQLKPELEGPRIERVREMIRHRMEIVYDTTNIVWASHLFGKTAGISTDESGQTVFDANPSLPDFTPADTARVLARWKDGQYTLGTFLGAYKAMSIPQRKNVNDPASFQGALDGYVLEPSLAQLAIERGLDRDPLAIAMIGKRREQLLVEHMFDDSVMSKVWIAPAERQKYYKDHQREFFSFRKVRYASILRGSQAGADSVVARLKAGEQADAILRADSLAGWDSGSIQERREDDHGTEFYKVLFEELKPGISRIVGPDRRGDYLVLYSIAYDPGHQLPYQDVQSIVDESLQNIKAEALLKSLIQRRRKLYSIETHPELLMKIRLVDPVLD